jgi:hypothetical protein
MELDKYRQAMSFLTNPKYINRDTVLVPFEGLSKEPGYSSITSREGLKEGTDPKKTKMILDMLRRGADVDTISTITGATVEEINNIAKTAKPISTEEPVNPEEGISKNKTYSEIDILSNIEAKFPGGNTRDDIVYNPMPNPVPRMDEYMPEFEGLEDPRYRQSELADGGIVEREGFANGKKLKPYGMTSYEMDQARIDNLNFEIEKRNKLGVKTIAPQLEKSTGYERSNINKLIQKGRVTRPLSKEELVTQYINKAIAENKTIGEMTKKAIGDYISADLPKGSKGRLENHTTAKIIKKQFPELFKTLYTKNSGALDQLARNTDLLDIPINDFIKDPTKIRRERSGSTIRKGQNTARLRILQGKLKLGPRDFAVSEAQDDFIVNINNAIKKDNNLVLKNPKLMELVSTTFDNTPGSPTYGQIISKARNEEKIKADIKKGFFSNEHLTPKALEKMNTEFPTNKLLIPRSTNSNLIKSSQNYLKNNRNDKNAIQALEGLTNKFNININTESGKIGPKQGATVEGNKLLSYENQLKTMGFNSPDVNFNIVKDITKEELQKTKSSMKEQVNRFKELLNPQEQNLVEKFGKQLNSGVPIDEIINSLPVREAQIVKNMGSKIASLSKLGLKGLQELTIGTGLAGIALTLGLQIPLTVYEASQGKSGSEMLNSATFGLLGKSENDILIEMGGEDAVKGLELEEKLNKLNDLKEQFKTADEEIRFTSPDDIATFNEDKIKEQILKRKNNIIKEYSDIANSIQENDLQYQKKLDEIRAAKLDREQARLDIGQMEAYNKPIDEIGISESGVFEEEINKANAEQNAKEKTKPVNKKPYPNVMQGTVGEPVDNIIDRNFAYAVGGRVGFKKGSKDKDSPVIPISPLTDLPQNESRRDFLKGIGAVGLGAVALGSGLLKLGKSLKTKEALSLLGKEAVGQPEWFAPLVDKIILKGIRLEKDGKKLDSYVLQEGDKTLTLNKKPYGTIEVDVQGGGAYDDTFTLRYNNSIGKNMYGEPTEFKDFKIIESRPKYQVSGMDESGFDYNLEPMEEYFSGKNLLKLEKNATGILSDVEGLEKIATGKIKDPKLAKTREQVRKKLIKIPEKDRIIENYDYEYDIDIPHEYND